MERIALGYTLAERSERTPCQRARRQNESVRTGALTRALNAAKLRRINEAIGICRDLLATTPDLPGALGLLGGILGQEGRTDEAIELLKAALARQPQCRQLAP